jgi:hypothetical protein
MARIKPPAAIQSGLLTACDCEKTTHMPANKTTSAATVAGKNGLSLISDAQFREMYAALLQCSLLDVRLHLYPGHEAWTGRLAGTAGVVACLRTGDTVTPTPRGAMAGYLHHGPDRLQFRKSPQPASSMLTVATGDALRHKLEKRGEVTVVFAPGSHADRMQNAFQAAAQQTLPALYVLEGDVPPAEVFGSIPVIRVDAADTVAVYRVAHESICRARDGGGPTIMECAPWPSKDEGEDPLTKLEHYLAAKKLFRRDWKQRLVQKYERAIADALDPLPSP